MRVGSLFTGYGGLDLALGGKLAWYSEIEPAACQVLSAHHPSVPNLGDVTLIDWSNVEPVDALTAGYPCQPFSKAGHRKGTNDERHLWPYVRDAIGALRPRLVVLENVLGHLTMGASLVVGELAGLGYDAQWGVVRASDAGAPHSRARLFIVANPHGGRHGKQQNAGRMGRLESPDADQAQERQRPWQILDSGSDTADPDSCGKQPQSSFAQTLWKQACDGNPSGFPWGPYRPAIERWGRIIGREAPPPAIGDPARLNTLFVEWMMGLPDGWVTGHGLSPSQELKMLGNGVCPQQADLALDLLGVA